MKRSIKNKGFALIEILITISIIAILFFVLIPQVNSFFIKSKESGLRSDFRTFQQSSEMYLRESLGKNLSISSLNVYMDQENELMIIDSKMRTKNNDPWGNAYESDFGFQKITFYSYGKEGISTKKPYFVTTYLYDGIIDSCTHGFETGNLSLTKIKNLDSSFTCGDDILTNVLPTDETLNAPSNFKATVVGSTNATLSWDSVSNASKYTLMKNNTIIYIGNSTSYSDITLSPGTSYTYQIASINNSYISSFSSLNVTTNSQAEKPSNDELSAPGNFKTTLIEYNRINLVWDRVEEVLEYELKRNGDVIYTGIGNSYSDVDLVAETSYQYEIIAKNQTKTSPSVKINAKTLTKPLEDGTCERPYLIKTVNDLQNIKKNLNACYALNNNIDASDTVNWDDGYGFKPIGDFSAPFKGSFDGKNYTISNLTINRPDEDEVGLFGFTYTATIHNVKIVNINILGGDWVGGLVASAINSNITKSYVSGNAIGFFGVGGLVGANISNSIITNSHVSGKVTGISNLGGLVGFNSNNAMIKNSYATNEINGTSTIGGLVGYNEANSSIINSYASGNVKGKEYLGGLVGKLFDNSSISASYSMGSVEGKTLLGGFAGVIDHSLIENSYSTGNVIGNTYVGGFAGQSQENSTIAYSYAIGSVNGTGNVGGFIGYNSNSVVTSSYYNFITSGRNDTGKGSGKSTAEMLQQSTYIDWDFLNTWDINPTVNNGYPFLK